MTDDLRATVQDPRALEGTWTEDSLALGRLLSRRFSCRAYRCAPVPRHVIERMLSLAQLSPSWCNSQPWQVIVTEGQGTERLREALFAHAQAVAAANKGLPNPQPDFPFPTTYHGVYKERQREVGWQLYHSVGVAHGDRDASAVQAMKNYRLFDAPHMLLITSERDLGIYGAIDCGVYLSSLLLAAQSLGIACIPQAALATYAPLMHEHFGIPDHRVIVTGVSFGHADEEHPANSFRSRRAPLADVVRWVTE